MMLTDLGGIFFNIHMGGGLGVVYCSYRCRVRIVTAGWSFVNYHESGDGYTGTFNNC